MVHRVSPKGLSLGSVRRAAGRHGDAVVIGTPTESNFSTDANAGWATETTLDVEWVHAIAPGAKILLVIAPTNFDSDLFAAITLYTTYDSRPPNPMADTHDVGIVPVLCR